jgi:hypothetical protein
MRIIAGAVVVAAVAFALRADGQAGRGKERSGYVDAVYGFTIDAPRFPKAKPSQSVAPVRFLAPAENGFASNVIVMIHPGKRTRAEYRKRELPQFAETGMKINAQRDVEVSGREAILLDYEGKQKDREFRFLTLVVFDADQVVHVNCTAPKKGFEKYEQAFRACLDSLKLQGAGK